MVASDHSWMSSAPWMIDASAPRTAALCTTLNSTAAKAVCTTVRTQTQDAYASNQSAVSVCALRCRILYFLLYRTGASPIDLTQPGHSTSKNSSSSSGTALRMKLAGHRHRHA